MSSTSTLGLRYELPSTVELVCPNLGNNAAQPCHYNFRPPIIHDYTAKRSTLELANECPKCYMKWNDEALNEFTKQAEKQIEEFVQASVMRLNTADLGHLGRAMWSHATDRGRKYLHAVGIEHDAVKSVEVVKSRMSGGDGVLIRYRISQDITDIVVEEAAFEFVLANYKPLVDDAF